MKADARTLIHPSLGVFVAAAVVVAMAGVSANSQLISSHTLDYVQSIVWLFIFMIVAGEVRRLQIQSNYMRKVFVCFAICFLCHLLLSLPAAEYLAVSISSELWSYLKILVSAAWPASCAMALHGLCLCIREIEQERKEKAQALSQAQESEGRWRAMFETAEDAVFYKDASRRYVHVNHSMERMLDRSRDHIVGYLDEDFASTPDVQTTKSEDLQVLKGATLDVEQEQQIRGQRRTLHVIKVPLRDSAGECVGLFGIARDITARRQAEEELRLTQFSLDWAVDMVLWVSPDGLVTYTNEAAKSVLGEAVRGQPLVDVDGRWPQIHAEYDLSAGTRYETEYQLPGGAKLAVEASVIRFSHQATELTCVFARDISERKRLQAENQTRLNDLSHLSRVHTAGEMVAGLAHELNQPLESLCNYGYILAKALAPDRKNTLDQKQLQSLYEKAEIMREQSLRAGTIIRHLRKLVNKRPPIRSVVDLNELVNDTVRLFDSQWLDAANPVSMEQAAGSLMAEVDSIQIQQVLLNLLTNARDAVRDRGDDSSITVRTKCDGAEITVSVEDNGVGFEQSDPEQLFQPFASTKEEGMGLGLAISRTIANVHGGDLSAAPAEGGGAIVRLHLPVYTSEQNKNETQSLRCG